MADLITVEEFRNYIGLGAKANESQNELMSACVASASEWIREAVNRELDFRAYAEKYDGNGLPYLWLKQDKVAASPMPTVTANGTALIAAPGYGVNADVILDGERGVLYRQSGPTQIVGNVSRLPNRWSIGIQNISATYSAGYATIPSDLKLLARYMAAVYRKEPDTKAVGVARRTTGAQSTDFMKDLPEMYQQTILQRRRVYFAR